MPKSSRLEFLEKFFAKSFASSVAENKTSRPLNRGGIKDLPCFVESTISNSPKTQRAMFLGCDGLFFHSICKFGSFKNPFAKITDYTLASKYSVGVNEKSDFYELTAAQVAWKSLAATVHKFTYTCIYNYLCIYKYLYVNKYR